MSREIYDTLKLDLWSTPYVFVYGTLKRGFSNNRLLVTAEFADVAVTDFESYLTDVGIPMLSSPTLKSVDSLPVKGEVFRIKDVETLLRLDTLEGHPHGYFRTQINVLTEKNLKIRAWTYFNNFKSKPAPVSVYKDMSVYEWKGDSK